MAGCDWREESAAVVVVDASKRPALVTDSPVAEQLARLAPTNSPWQGLDVLVQPLLFLAYYHHISSLRQLLLLASLASPLLPHSNGSSPLRW